MDDSKPLMKILRDMGYDVKTASNTLSDEAVKKIREVVAPHMDQARKGTSPPVAKAEDTKKSSTPAQGAKVRVPERVVRIANRATSAEKEAILDRHRRKQAGESPVESALEAKQATLEPVIAPPPPPPVVEVAPAPPEIVVEVPAPVEAPSLPEVVAATEVARPGEAARPRPAPVDQQSAGEQRERPPVAPVPIAPVPVQPPAPAATDNRQGNFQKPAGGPKTREISPSRGGGPAGGAKKPVKPGVSVAPGLTHQQKPQGRFGGRQQHGRGGPRRGHSSHSHVRVETVKALDLPEFISVADLASRLGISPGEVIKALIKEGQMVSINQALDYGTAARLAADQGFTVGESADEIADMELLETEDISETNYSKGSLLLILQQYD